MRIDAMSIMKSGYVSGIVCFLVKAPWGYSGVRRRDAPVYSSLRRHRLDRYALVR